MCGIAGFITNNLSDRNSNDLSSMLNQIEHRGPDDSGQWTLGGVHMGHRRLAIHDLTMSGHQPMVSSSGRYIIVFNGEIYNFKALRLEFHKDNWIGTSDTEVLLHVIECVGLEFALTKLNGMFAFAIYDSALEVLSLCRDPMGEKPLYYGKIQDRFYFASELSSIEAVCAGHLSICREAVYQQAMVSYIPAPDSIYKGIYKLEPASYVTYSGGTVANSKSFWSLDETIDSSRENLFYDKSEGIGELERVIERSVVLRMSSDVPVGAFLSGGTDSSLISALMSKNSIQPINTFTIGFENSAYDESISAKAIANHLGANHTEAIFSAADILEWVPKMGHVYSEPFSDSSQLPMCLVSALAGEKVKVVLSGDGGDELFFGYHRYQATKDIWEKMRYVPARSMVAKFLRTTPTRILDIFFFYLGHHAAKYGRTSSVGNKLKTLSRWIDATSIENFYIASMMHFGTQESVVFGVDNQSALSFFHIKSAMLDDFDEWMMAVDTLNYLPDDILTKIDRATMSVGLEGRVPLLDPAVVAMAWRFPLSHKICEGVPKWPLKQILNKYVPLRLTDRPKTGFGVPIDYWLRNELNEWAQDLLSFNRLKEQELYNPHLICNLLTRHLEGKENNGAKLWNVLMFQSWLDANPNRKLAL
jgi:asparagine synthase (glutamine-hydrolysing)